VKELALERESCLPDEIELYNGLPYGGFTVDVGRAESELEICSKT